MGLFESILSSSSSLKLFVCFLVGRARERGEETGGSHTGIHTGDWELSVMERMKPSTYFFILIPGDFYDDRRKSMYS